MAKESKREVEAEGQFIQLDPNLIEADPKHNARFGLIPDRIKKLATEIVDAGGVMEPIEVAPLTPAVNGFRYRLVFGNYRLAAVKQLNGEGAGLTIPAIVKETKEGLDSTIRNLMENIARQDLTTMDTAHAIKLLLDGGMEKMKVREMFARPNRPGPASNSWVNITLALLDLPKPIQAKLHTGEITWDGGATLVKVKQDNPAKFDEVVAQLEADRVKAIEKETKEEERLLAAIRKAEQAGNKEKEQEQKVANAAAEALKKLQVARDAVAKADVDNADLIAKAKEALVAASAKVTEDPSAHKEVAEAAKHLENTQKAAVREKDRAAKALAAIEAKQAQEAKDAQEKLKADREETKVAKATADAAKKAAKPAGGVAPKKAADKPISAADVKKAAAKAGAPTGVKVLNRTEMMEVVNAMSLPFGEGKAEVMVTKIGKALKSCFNSVTTQNQLFKELLKICGGK